MPHLEIVAGGAYCRSKVSQIMQQWGCNLMRSPFGSGSNLLSPRSLWERRDATKLPLHIHETCRRSTASRRTASRVDAIFPKFKLRN